MASREREREFTFAKNVVQPTLFDDIGPTLGQFSYAGWESPLLCRFSYLCGVTFSLVLLGLPVPLPPLLDCIAVIFVMTSASPVAADARTSSFLRARGQCLSKCGWFFSRTSSSTRGLSSGKIKKNSGGRHRGAETLTSL